MIHSFLLIGQSNMAGRGFFQDVEPIVDDRLLVLRNGRWQRMYAPVNGDRPFSGVCLAESFALAYADAHPGVQVGLIPCADGGTGIQQWQEGTLLFDHAVYQTWLALRTSNLAGILWHQGEGDCRPERYPFYEERFTKMLSALRKELKIDADVPVLVGGLGEFLTIRAQENPKNDFLANWPIVDKALRQIAEKDPMIGYVSAKGLESNPDHLHFCAKALREFGRRYFEEFSKLENKQKVFEEKPREDGAVRSEMELL